MFEKQMFENMNEVVKESTERWKEIELWSGLIKKHLESGQKMNDINIDRLATLILLVVDHLRPMNPSQEQIDEATKGITDLLKSFKK